jgi:hypothetical protein
MGVAAAGDSLPRPSTTTNVTTAEAAPTRVAGTRAAITKVAAVTD